jgi:cytochrome c-type biogenesis protein CcmF
MEYIGEHLLPGKLGHLAVFLSFASTLVALIAFFKASVAKNIEEELSWKRFARIAFALDFFAILSVFGTILYIVSHHLFEYNFAWEHSSRALDMQYLFACIWESQEGSFLLWSFWNCALGTILIFKAGKWEAPVMTVICFTQVCIATMILGLYLFGAKIGINPFLLMRQQFADGPLFSRPDYLSLPQMQDGQGLNSLLQNYWMVIHPPVLFLGFASTVVPFAYAIAGLWKKQYAAWTKIALPWTLFSVCVLGTGVMMGGAWAYESLTFGGYWAWDPVENASLVPWLVLVAGLHTQLIFNATGHSLRATFFFLILGFLLILYATFLTRSGALNGNSVHAFVDEGLNAQLIGFVLIFLFPSLFLFIRGYKKIPHIAKEESTYSREFWMFIGALVLFLSALFISGWSSLPVINKIINTKWTIGEDTTFFYNRVEIFIAIIIGLLTAITQYLKYKNTGRQYFFKKIMVPTVIALFFSVGISVFGQVDYDKYGPGFLTAIHIALFAAIYSVVANAGYIWAGLGGKFKAAGASVAHIGFGLMLIGILLSSAKQKILSINTTGINLPFDPSTKQNPLENLTLLRNVKTDMGKYWTTYINSDSTNPAGNITYFRINFQKKDGKEAFDLYPNLIKTTKGQEGFSQNPDKHHYLNSDIFTYVTYTDKMEDTKDTNGFKKYPVTTHDTVYYSKGYLVINKITANPENGKFHFKPTDTALLAEITVFGNDSSRYAANTAFFVKNNQLHLIADTIYEQNLVLSLNGLAADNKLELDLKESNRLVPYVSLKVIEFPQINILWIGTLIMIFGLIMSIIRRVKMRLSVT